MNILELAQANQSYNTATDVDAFKQAFKEGKTIQGLRDGVWVTLYEPCWIEGNQYRIKEDS